MTAKKKAAPKEAVNYDTSQDSIPDISAYLDKIKVEITDTIKEENSRLYREIKKREQPQAWYKSIGIWIAILLTIIVLYLLYIFYMSESGHTVEVPSWLNSQINLR